MKKRILSMVLVAMLVIATMPVAADAVQTRDPVGMNISGFVSEDLYGNSVTGSILSEYALTFVNFWATWCGPCTSEMPHIQRLYEEYDGFGVNVLGLLCETGDCTVAKARAYCENNDITYSTIRMDSVLLQAINNSGEYIPVTWLVDSTGEILAYVVGSMSYGNMVELVETYLDHPQPEAITIKPDEDVTLSVGRFAKYDVRFVPANAERSEVSWESSNESVATVTSKGLIQAVGEGTATITASLALGLSDSITVTVTERDTVLPEKYYLETDTIVAGKAYLIVVETEGGHVVMSNKLAVNNRSRLKGMPVAVEDLLLSEDGEMLFLDVPDGCRWLFNTNESDPTGFDIINEQDGLFLSYINSGGAPRLTTKTKSASYWMHDGDLLLRPNDLQSRYITYCTAEGFDDVENFDLLLKSFTDFRAIKFYELKGEEPTPTVLLGDANCDGTVNTGDASAILQSTIGAYVLTEQGMINSDFNEDGVVNTGDASGILQLMVK